MRFSFFGGGRGGYPPPSISPNTMEVKISADLPVDSFMQTLSSVENIPPENCRQLMWIIYLAQLYWALILKRDIEFYFFFLLNAVSITN